MTVDLAANAGNRIATAVERNGIALVALAATLLFYLPALFYDAGFLYTGDVLGFYWPSLVKMHALISSFHFSGVDFSLFNGSSDVFLTSNFFWAHPFFVLAFLVAPGRLSVPEIGQLLVDVLALHSFLACYFSLKLFTRFYKFDLLPACFIAITFAFSIHVVTAMGEPQFVFCVSAVAWCAYASLDFESRPSIARLLFASLPVLVAFLGGYIPLGVACIAVSVALVAVQLFLFAEAQPFEKLVHRLIRSLAPIGFGSAIAAPYLLAAYLYLQKTPANNVASSLFYSAHQMAEPPQALLRILSSHYDVPGAFFEFSSHWGFIALTIVAVFLLSQNRLDALPARDYNLLKVAAAVYFLVLLSTFGQFSAVSDLVYYLVPQVGTMHIYQRFLVPAQVFLSLLLVLMLKWIVETRPLASLRLALAIFTTLTLVAANLAARNPSFSLQQLGIDNYIVFELLLTILFLFALLLPGKAFAYVAAIFLFNLPILDRMYDYSIIQNTRVEQQKISVLSLDDAERARLVTYLRRFNDKDLIKYVDLTPMWSDDFKELFPKSFPYLVLDQLHLSSYHGFNYYLSAREEYNRMPVQGSRRMGVPDWEWIRNTGADFVVALESDMNAGLLTPVIAEADTANLLRLAKGMVLVPLRGAAPSPDSLPRMFDNGYFRVSPSREKNALANIAVGKAAIQSSTASGGVASRAVDGNTNGAFSAGSVTHTLADINAWLEVDLGAVEPIDSVRVWNRADNIGDRLAGSWLFISERPFSPNETADMLRKRPATWARGMLSTLTQTIRVGGQRGRYVRIQLGGHRPVEVSFLSLAEVEVFRSEAEPVQSTAPSLKRSGFYTNDANYLRLDLESSVPVTVEYLLSHNPRLQYYLNGSPVTFAERDKFPLALALPTGLNRIEIRYRNWPLTVFFVVYGLYAIALIGAAAAKSYFYLSEFGKVLRRHVS